MFLALSDEQDFLADAAAGLLARRDTVAAARAALDGDDAPDLWELGVDAGWPGLLIGEDADGTGLGAYEATLVLEACGRVLADARLLGHLPACALLEQADADRGLRASLAAGEQRAALVDGTLADLRARLDGGAVIFDGAVGAVPDAPDADLLVVVGVDPDGQPLAAMLEGQAAGAAVRREASYDATRRLGAVELRGVRGEALKPSPERIRDGRDMQRLLLAAEAVGGADACLRMARDYAVDRHAFGRAIGSYQAIKHKLVEMLRRVESGRSLLAYAGRAWLESRLEFALAANAARVVSGDALDYAAPENIFIHGGIGATWEHDAQLYYRRAEVSRRLAGGSEAAADDVAGALFARTLA